MRYCSLLVFLVLAGCNSSVDPKTPVKSLDLCVPSDWDCGKGDSLFYWDSTAVKPRGLLLLTKHQREVGEFLLGQCAGVREDSLTQYFVGDIDTVYYRWVYDSGVRTETEQFIFAYSSHYTKVFLPCAP